jgi:cullin-4
MFGDVENSDVLSNKFRQEYSDQLRADGLSTDVKVFALTQGIWPPQVDIIVKNLPGEFVRYQELFEKFYTAAHNARKLQWIHHLGQCILKVKFEKRTHELIMSMLQAAVLMLFEGSGSLTFQEVRTQLGIEEKRSSAC